MNKRDFAEWRPYIQVKIAWHDHCGFIFFANTGKSTARDVEIQIDPDYFRFGEEKRNLKGMNLIKNGVQEFHPGYEYYIQLNGAPSLIKEGVSFEVICKYFYESHLFYETTNLDFSSEQDTSFQPNAVATEISKLRKVIEK